MFGHNAYSKKYCPDELKTVQYFAGASREVLWSIGSPLAPTQTWAEFGVGSGNSARRLAKLLADDGTFYLFDSWQGIPEPWKLGDNLTEPAGKWKYPKMRTNDDRFVFVDGWYEDTLPFEFPEQIGLLHIDCDVYSSTKTVLQAVTPYLGPGTVFIFDELWGYQYYADHEYKALKEWQSETGIEIGWHGRTTFEAIGVVL
jgi:hypothetical protein